jgi:serine protease AprX
VLPRWAAAVVAASLVLAGMPRLAAADDSYNSTKIAPSFLAEVRANPQRFFDVIVRAGRTEDDDKTGQQAERAGKAIRRATGEAKRPLGIVGATSARIRGSKLLDLSRDGDVEYIAKDDVLRAHFDPLLDAAAAIGTGVLSIDARRVWTQLGVTGRGIAVAVVDSGVAAHPDLAGRIVASIDFTSDNPQVTTTLSDPGGHGTHVAGLIAGDGKSSGGAFTGIAPNAEIVSVRVFDANGSAMLSTVLQGLQWIVNNRSTYNIRVANLSFGATPSGSYRTDLLAAAVEVLTFANVTVVAAAGNGGPGPGTVTTPGYDPFVITVGAADTTLSTAPLAATVPFWSARGPTPFDGHDKPDIIAPGRKLIGPLAISGALAGLYPDRIVTALGASIPSYFSMSGTSMSAAIVSGTVALMLERNPSLTPRQIKTRLRDTAIELPYTSEKAMGAGIVNALSAVGSNSSGWSYTSQSVSDSFARDMYRSLLGQTITWRSSYSNGGVDSAGIPWSNITWNNITWNNITWNNIVWEAFTWTNITWTNITWQNVTWLTTSTQGIGILSGTGWRLVD